VPEANKALMIAVVRVLIFEDLERAVRVEEERDLARQAFDRMTEQMAAVLAELPPARPGTALGLPLHQQVRDSRLHSERVDKAARAFVDWYYDGRTGNSGPYVEALRAALED
jgi:hypothetical protein